MDSSKRLHHPSALALEGKLSQVEDDLNEIIHLNLSDYKNDYEQLTALATKSKALFREFSEISTTLFDLKTKVGSIAESDEIREHRLDMKREIKQLIKVVNGYLGDDHNNVSFNTTFHNTSNEGIVAESPNGNLNEFVEPMRTSSPSFEQPASRFIAEEVTDLRTNFNLASHSFTPKISVFQPRSVEPLKFSEGMYIPPAQSSFIPKTVTAVNVGNLPSAPLVSSSTCTVGSVIPNLLPTFLPESIRPGPPIISSVPNYTSPTPYPHYPFNGHHNILSSAVMGGMSTVGSTFATASTYVPPLYSSTIPSNRTSAFGLRCPTVVGSTSNQDQLNAVLSNQILKGQLFQKIGDPFDGDPLKYHAWVNVMNRKMTGITLDSWDILTVLYENSSGNPKKVIEEYMTIGAADPQLTLGKVWQALYDQFGTGTRISSSIFCKLDSFPHIKSVHNTEKLRELINLCNVIIVNISVAEELNIFNLSIGMRKIWVKLPEPFQNSWRSHFNEFKTKNNVSSTPLSHLVHFLERKYAEYSDPSFDRSIPAQVSSRTIDRPNAHYTLARPVDRNTLKTSFAETVTSVRSDSDHCLIHPDANHTFIECNAFIKKPFSEKRAIIVENKRCFVCLGEHFKDSCKSNIKCKTCNQKHATAMHREPRYESTKALTDSYLHVTPENDVESLDNSASLCTGICGSVQSRSCSKIVLVELDMPARNSKKLLCYAILDEQSSSSFIDPKVAAFFGLNLPLNDYKIRTLTGLTNSIQGMEVSGMTVKGVGQRKVIHLPTLLTNDFIPECKSEIASPAIVSQHSHISHLAKHFLPPNDKADILMLIGRDCGEAMATQCHGYRAPYAHRTPLGWALVGIVCTQGVKRPITNTVLKSSVSHCIQDHLAAKPSFESKQSYSTLDRNPFIEFPDDEIDGLSKDDSQFMTKLTSSIHTNSDGCIEVPLPFRHEFFEFPDNRASVYNRMISTLNKLKGESNKLSECLACMSKNIEAGHVEVCNPIIDKPIPGKCWYLPIFAVTQPKKKKVRLVFDAAASYGGTSLNDQLLKGPDVNNQLVEVLHRFRIKEIGFTADIEAMFYAFHLPPSDRDFTRFFWWKDNDISKPLVEYRATRHIFGNRSSPSIANLGLRYAITNSNSATLCSTDFVFDNFYVDDGCGSSDTVTGAIETLEKTRTALSSYKIRLHKIMSNSEDVLKGFPLSELSSSRTGKEFNRLETQRTLGVEWNPSTDLFVVRTNVPEKPFTKRGTLATTNSLFDPLGFVSPISLAGRLLQREFLKSKNSDLNASDLKWDDPLPDEYRPSWNEWVESIRQCDEVLNLPRCHHPPGFGTLKERTLHVFSDASTVATGCVVYLRSVNSQNQVFVAFIAGSSRVAPRGALSVPRLELCAAVEASSIALRIAMTLNLSTTLTRFYSDSNVVLGYIYNAERSFPRYVTRRVSLILKTSVPSQWSYVASEDNPGDIASRPQTCEALNNSCWFKGPNYLWQDSLPSVSEITHSFHSLPEELDFKTTLKSTSEVKETTSVSTVMERVDTWSKLLNVTKLILKFISKLKVSVMLRRNETVSEQSSHTTALALMHIVKSIQLSAFPEYISDSKVNPKSRLDDLSPFLDEEGILRVGGRLRQSNLPLTHKSPIILPPTHPGTVLLIRHYHQKVKHQGRIITLGAIREAGFYIFRGTSALKKFLGSCVTCRKLRSNVLSQKMSDLPFDRLEQNPPFTYCGMDVFGPFLVQEGTQTRRRSSTVKVWAIVFICLVTKAVHIEMLPLMDTSSFKNALRRFFSIRGVCRRLRSDRGTNFVGANNQEKQDLDFESLKEEVSSHECEWVFNPPHASNFGGIWERAIRSFRKILDASLRILGERAPSRDELGTFLCEAAAIINNTPMYEHSNNPDDLLPITPAHLLTMKENPNPPPLETFCDKDFLSYGSRRWRRVQVISADFWRRWQTEYAHQLQTRQKWMKEMPNLAKGDIVLLKIKNRRRNHWPLARVSEVHKSNDGLVRSASLTLVGPDRSSSVRIFHRPISEIIPILRSCEA